MPAQTADSSQVLHISKHRPRLDSSTGAPTGARHLNAGLQRSLAWPNIMEPGQGETAEQQFIEIGVSCPMSF